MCVYIYIYIHKGPETRAGFSSLSRKRFVFHRLDNVNKCVYIYIYIYLHVHLRVYGYS